MKVVIAGCGLGGLACAIQCRRDDVDVVILEKTAELSEVGAGIQLPPNATKVMSDFGLLDKLYATGMMAEGPRCLLRWQDGSEIARRPGRDWARAKFGHFWHLIHRADYQRVLVDEAKRLGVDIRLDAEVVSVDASNASPSVTLHTGEVVKGDVVIGGDGLRSAVRTAVLGKVQEPEPSGDLAYRITIPREQVLEESDPFFHDLIDGKINGLWWGQNQHVVAYSVRNGEVLNVVLCCPDDLPATDDRTAGDLGEMQDLFRGWDPRLQILLSKVTTVKKWKIWTMPELSTWVKGAVAILGDACHPSVPYAASGAAMAVEDGAALGRLLGLFSARHKAREQMPALLWLYQRVRKDRAESTVRFANSNRVLFHMVDGDKQRERDNAFGGHDWWDEVRGFPWMYADLAGLRELHTYDTLRSATEAFENEKWEE